MVAVGIVSLLVSKCFSSYTSDCEEDPELNSLCSSLEQRFNKFKSALAPGGKTDNYSLNAVKSLCGFLVELNQNLAEEIIVSKDALKNEELRSLVDLYYESSTRTLDLFNNVEKCTKKAQLSILTIQIAMELFEKESMDTDFGGNLKKKKKKYEETLEKLNKVKAMGDPFGDEYKNQLKSVRADQSMLLNKFHELVLKLDKKKEKLKRRRRLVTIVFATASLSFFALEMYASIYAPPLLLNKAVEAATALSCVIAIVGMLGEEVKKHREKELDRQKEAVNKMKDNTNVNKQGTETIHSLVERLIMSLSFILGSVDLAVVKREEESVKRVMETIRDEVVTFSTTIDEVCEAVVRCSKCVVSGKVNVLEHITKSAH